MLQPHSPNMPGVHGKSESAHALGQVLAGSLPAFLHLTSVSDFTWVVLECGTPIIHMVNQSYPLNKVDIDDLVRRTQCTNGDKRHKESASSHKVGNIMDEMLQEDWG